MNVFVTGGTGKIGSAVVKALLRRHSEVAVLCRTPAAVRATLILGAMPIAGDLRNPREWIQQIRGFDAVVHTACTFDSQMPEVDLAVTQALLRKLQPENGQKKKFLYTGGIWCWGDTQSGALDESMPFDPVPEFAWCVSNSRSVLRASHLDGIVVHPALVVDRNVNRGLPDVLITENRGSQRLHLPGHADMRWPLVDASDLAEAYCAALERAGAGEEFLVASEPGVTMRNLARATANTLKLTAPTVYEPLSYWQCRYGAWAAGYFRNQAVQSHRAASHLGWRPSFRLQIC